MEMVEHKVLASRDGGSSARPVREAELEPTEGRYIEGRRVQAAYEGVDT